MTSNPPGVPVRAVPPARRWTITLAVAATAALVPSGPALAGGPPGSGAGSGHAPTSVHGIDLDAATIPQLQAAMGKGRLTAAELTKAYLARIKALDPRVGAVTRVNPQAVADAQASDRTRKRSGARSPLEGIPVLLKDNVDKQGMATTAGSLALAGTRPDDATLTRELEDAGAVVLGKANLSEWANFRSTHSTSGWSGVGGQTNNPYVLDRNPCGSSSGSAAGVAASLAQVAIGTETDGSIVCPSGANGDVGIKPTLGMVSRDGIVPISAEQDTAGPIARHAIDAALTLQVISGADRKDAATQKRPAKLDTAFGKLDPNALKGARIGVWELSAEDRTAVGEATAALFDKAVRTLHEAGATTVPLKFDAATQTTIGDDEGKALDAEFKRDVDKYLRQTGGRHPADLQGLIDFDNANAARELQYFGQETFLEAQASPPTTDPTIVKARTEARTLARKLIDGALTQGAGPADDLDAIVGLTNTPAWVTKYQNRDGEADRFVYSTSGPAAVAGYPDVTVPAGLAMPVGVSGPGALPVGVSFFGARWDDAHVIDLAADFEDAAQARRAPTYKRTVGPDPALPAPAGS